MGQTNILTLLEAEHKLSSQQKKMVIAGGCFDLLHPGHTAFLKASKDEGELLVVLLESDQKISEIKGKDRPHNTQKIRAENLALLHIIDYIILLPYFSGNENYDRVIYSLKPAIIATTFGDPYRFHKERQALSIGAQVIDVIERLPEYSSTKILTNL